MTFEIDSSIPVPLPPGDEQRIYPWPDMRVGDCVTIPGDAARIRSVRVSASRFAARMRWRFTCRKQDDGVRVWRVA